MTLHVMGEGQHDGVGAVRCRAVVLASGGLGQVFSQTTNPAVVDRRRDGAGLPGRRGAARPRVRAVPPDRDVARPRLPWPAAADLRGGARRGRLPRRLGGPAGSCRACTSWPTWRPATWSRRRSPAGCWRPATRTCGSTPGTWARRALGDALPDDPRHLPAVRRRPGDRADPGRAGLPLRLRWRRHRPLGPVQPAAVSTPPARSRAPGCTAPTGWPPTRCSRAWCSRAGSPRCCPGELGPGATPCRTRAGRSSRQGARCAPCRRR